jgi:hypothetical protein
VLAIDVGEIMRQIQTIMDQVSRAVEFVFLFTLAGGCSCCRPRSPRRRTSAASIAAVLRTLGASQAQLTSSQLAEFACSVCSRACSRRRGHHHRLRARRSRVPDPVSLQRDGVGVRSASAGRCA